MNNKQQTAVQYLMEQLSYYNPEAHAELIVKGDYCDAITMEQKQMVNAHIAGQKFHSNFWQLGDALDYFKDTYNTEP